MCLKFENFTMWWQVVVACSVMVFATELTNNSEYYTVKPEDFVESMPPVSISSALGASLIDGRLIENIRRKLMIDNYDYINDENEYNNTNMKTGMSYKLRQKLKNMIKTSSIEHSHASFNKTYNQRGVDKSELIISTPKYKAWGNEPLSAQVDMLRKNDIEFLKNDLHYDLYNINLRRNNDISSDISSSRLENVNHFINSENSTTTTRKSKKKRKANKSRLRHHLRRKMYDSDRVYRRKGKRNKYEGHENTHDQEYRPNQHSYRKSINSNNVQDNIEEKTNDKFNELVQNSFEMNEKIKDLRDDEQNSSIKISTALTMHEIKYQKQKDNNTDQIINKVSQNIDKSNIEGIDYSRQNKNTSDHRESVLQSHGAENLNRLFSGKEGEREIRDDHKSEPQNNNIVPKVITQVTNSDVVEVSTNENVKYKLLKMRFGHHFRRSGVATERHLLQERKPEGVRIISLDKGPFPQFRLPPSRRQYMDGHVDRRPPLVEHLPRNYHLSRKLNY